MKVILDTPEEDMGAALNAVFQTQLQNPDQQVGGEFAIIVEVNGNTFEVIRNLNSYTIRGEEQERI
jgi:hypothetical protein|tara:strand:- start:301 stop:498 length:198 start_codon:yes stop_codon:yes gene_type:complete